MLAAFDNGESEKSEPGKTLRPLLRAFNSASGDIEASAVISTDGLSMAWVLDENTDPDRFGAMCASLLALANRAAQEISRGKLKQVLVEGDKGTMLLVYAGNESVLAVASKPTMNLGKIFLDAKKTAEKIAQVLENISY
ncbi:hypothetical protein MNBD_GAMMA09-2521 [hydrothermal vent metagenome]|uniref:Roadblock/LAMTOR2 domain-containing protein n=1 Tax=hydrothermal vent metagenome TaxID=652676 RepID=A0A3B0YKW3_9ZZZZ